jgi:uroporphyrinogen decarboxylase
LNTKNRFLKLFRSEPVDRIPVAPFIHVNFVKEFFNSHEIDAVIRTIDVYNHFGFDIIHRNCTPGYDDISLNGDNWTVSKTIEKNGLDQVTCTTIDTPGGKLNEVHKLSCISKYDAEASAIEYFIKSVADFELFRKYHPPVGLVDMSMTRRAIASVADNGIVAPWVQGAFNFVAFFYMRVDDLMLLAKTEQQVYHELMRYFLDRNKKIITQFIDGGVPVLSYAGNIASGKMVGRDFFREFVFPYEKELIEFIQGKGVIVLYHNCGYAANLMPVYNDLGIRAYESLTPPPFGDTILEQAFENFNPEIVLCGNIDQIEFLKTATPAQVRQQVKDVLEMAKKRGNFILNTTDYFGEETPHENILAMADAGREYGSY